MMRTGMAMTTSIVGGSRIGASAVQYLHAQAMPPAYVVTDADVANVDAYTREYLPLVRKAFVEGGEKYLASNGRVLAVAAEPPRRLAILVFVEKGTDRVDIFGVQRCQSRWPKIR